jgi:arylsulfatase A-like enzyme
VRSARFILEKIARPWLVGAITLVVLALLAVGAPDENAQTLGAHADAINGFIRARYSGEIFRLVIAITVVAACVGALIGAAAGVLVQLRDRASGKTRSQLSLLFHALLVTIAIQAWCETLAMATTPALYVDAFYARGGLRRTLQVLAADALGRGGVWLLGIVLLAFYLAGPLSIWPSWPDRFRSGISGIRASVKSRGIPLASVFLVLSALAILISGSHKIARAADAPAANKPNVLILAADSFRFDRLTPRTAPNLSALAEKGTRFDRAYVSLPRTFPSWTTILTGRHPHHHGIRSMFPRWEDRAKDFDALPSRLARAGYKTSVVSDFAGDIFGRIDLGFQNVETPMFDMRELVRQRALERETPLLPYLNGRAGRAIFPVLRELPDASAPQLLAGDALGEIDRANGNPFFVTVFFSAAHFPYAAPAPYETKFTNPNYRGRFKYDKPVGLGKDAPPDDDDVAQIRGLYDGAISSIDDSCEKIIRGLEDRHLLGNTIILITADHGETLYEANHGSGHGDHLFGDEGTHVPFVIVDPRHAPQQRNQSVVRDVDIAPTLYALTDVAAPNDLDGRSLVPALNGAALQDAYAYAETGLWFTQEIPAVSNDLRLPYPTLEGITELDPDHGDEIVIAEEMKNLTVVAKHRMIRDARFKLIYAPTRMGVVYMLFDTVADPMETHDVASTHAADVARLKSELWRWMLQDKAMVERNGFLVPRDDRVQSATTGVRVQQAQEAAK